MAHNSVHGRYFAGKQVKCEFVSLTKWKVAICGEYMKSRLKTCSRGSACNFLHCFSNPGGDYEWADCDKPPPRYWVKKMTALFGYSDDSWHAKQIEQPSPKDSKIFTSDRDSYHSKRRRSYQTDGGSGRSHHEENHARKSRHHEHQRDDKSYEDETEYKNDPHQKNTHRRHHDDSENRLSHNRRDYYGRRSRSRTHGSSSSDEDLYTERRNAYKKRRSRHRSESSNDDGESDELSETELQKRKTGSVRRSRRRDDYRESEKEPFIKKQKRSSRKSASCRSRDSGYLSEKNDDKSDRWDPDEEHGEHSSKKVDYEISQDRETHSGGLEEESKNRQSRDRDQRTRKRI